MGTTDLKRRCFVEASEAMLLLRGLLVFMALSIVPVASQDLGAHRDQMLWSDQQWQQLRIEIELLDRITYFPSLLPVIMLHRDSIGLTDEQLGRFRQWRRNNYQEMVELMNEIIRHRFAFSRDALDIDVSDEELVASQGRLFSLQARLLHIRLSCRKIILNTFTTEQWSNLAFVLEDYPAFAGMLANVGGGMQEQSDYGGKSD